jgi:fumarylpyruvate hydrolase
MNNVDRRTVLASGALALAGAATQGGAAEAQAGAKPIFSVPAIAIPIVGEEGVFPVRRIYCIGRNYAAHAIERGSDPNREPPFFSRSRRTPSRTWRSEPWGTIRILH